jgi:flagellar basal body rod protein FlgG
MLRVEPMNVSIAQATSALNANSRWQDMITENLASSSVPGYRKQEISFSGIQAGHLSTANASSGSTASSITYPKATITSNLQAGETYPTGVSTHLAIEGKGFFELELANGKKCYTRCGQFHVDAAGHLVTTGGNLVMGENEPVKLDPTQSTQITISSQGDISQGAESRGKIKVVEFNDPNLLTSIGKGYFAADSSQIAVSATPTSSVSQGYLETANTSPISEMSNLITSMRTYEANQRVIQLTDERTSRTINDLGNPS